MFKLKRLQSFISKLLTSKRAKRLEAINRKRKARRARSSESYSVQFIGMSTAMADVVRKANAREVSEYRAQAERRLSDEP